MEFDYSNLHDHPDLILYNERIEEGQYHQIDKAALGEAVIKAIGEELHREITSGHHHPLESHQFLFIKIAEDYINSVTQEKAHQIFDKIKKEREDFPLRNSVFQAEMKLFFAEKTLQELKSHPVKEEASKKVSRLENERKEAVAYLKEGLASTMEEVVWRVGVAMHYEDVLTATKSKGSKGDLQLAQEGISLDEYITKSEPFQISREPLITATLASLVLGMYDANAENIILTNDSIKFIDNTRSLAHSSQYIIWKNGEILLPYRCALLALKGSYEPFSTSERQGIQKRMSDDINRLKTLSSQTHWQTRKLPSQWLNPKEALDAMQERLIRMQQAMNKPQVQSLRDLVFETIPQFRFVAALTYGARMLNNQYTLMDLFESTGGVVLGKLLDECASKGLDPSAIKKWCETLPFEKVIEAINHVKPVDKIKCQQAAAEIKKEALSRARYDLKDVPPDQIEHTFLKVEKIKVELEQFLSKNALYRFEDALKSTSLKIYRNFEQLDNDTRPLGRSIVIDGLNAYFIAKDVSGKGIRIKAKLDYSETNQVKLSSIEIMKNGHPHQIDYAVSFSIDDGKVIEKTFKSLMVFAKEIEKTFPL